MRITVLKDKHRGETAWVVGLGPSIADLYAGCFGPGPIITLNQAIAKVQKLDLTNQLYSQQKDDDPPAYIIPEHGIPVILHTEESVKTFPEYEPRYIFDAQKDFQLQYNTISIIIAVEIAVLMGCKTVKFVCCDAHAKSVLGTYVPKSTGEWYTDNATIRNFCLEGQIMSLRWYLSQKNLEVGFITPGEKEIFFPAGVGLKPRIFFMGKGKMAELR